MSVLMQAWLSAALLAGPPPADAATQVERIFADERYGFCAAETDYRPSREDLVWCDLAAQSRSHGCPGYAKICETDDEVLAAKLGDGGGQQDETKSTTQPSSSVEIEQQDEREPADLSGFAKVLMWGLLIALAAWALITLMRSLVRDRARDDAEPPPVDDPGDSLAAARIEAMRVLETDVQRLLARAEAAAGAGRHDDAIADVHAALLRRLEGERLISVDRWKTTGDYLQALRAKPGLRDEIRVVVREVEQVQFGSATADGSRYASVRTKVIAIVSRSALLLALLVGLAAQAACDQPTAKVVPPLGTGPSGQRAIAELLIDNHIDVRLWMRGLDQLPQSHGALVLYDESEPTAEDWDRLLGWVEDGGVLVVATGLEFPRRLGVDYVPPTSEDTVLVHAGAPCCAAPPGRTITTRGPHQAVLERPADSAWGQARPYVLRRELGKGTLVVFAEPVLLTNAALLVEGNAAVLLGLFQSLDVDEVEFLRLISMSDADPADNPFESMRNARLGALFLQVLLFLALLYAAVGIPFARLRDPPAQRRRAFSEHVRTLGARYAQARAARHVAALYSGWALDRLRARLQPVGGRSLHALAETIASRTGRSTEDVMQILADAHSLRDYSPAQDSEARGGAADLALMRQLAALLDQTR